VARSWAIARAGLKVMLLTGYAEPVELNTSPGENMGELQRDKIDRLFGNCYGGNMENRDSYLAERFGGIEGYGKFFHDLTETEADPSAVDKAINQLTNKLKDPSRDLTKIEDIRAWATKIFHRELGKAIEQDRAKPIRPTLGLRESESEPATRDSQIKSGEWGLRTFQIKGAERAIPEESSMSFLLSALEDEDKTEQLTEGLLRQKKQYREAKDLVDNLDGKFKDLMEKYLQRYTEQQIADDTGVKSRQAISKIIVSQLEKWRWSKEQVEQIRNAWLFEALKDIAKKVEAERTVREWPSKAYQEWLFELITTDPRTKRFAAKYTIDNMPELDNTLDGLGKLTNFPDPPSSI
jgi:hypothetical protein